MLADYRRRFGGEAGAYALYGYEAMSVVLDAIRAAGPRGNDRQPVIEQVFANRARDSVLGRYSIQPDGETTLTRYGVDRVAHGRLVVLPCAVAEPAPAQAEDDPEALEPAAGCARRRRAW